MTAARCVIALDLGGTLLKAGLVDEAGATLLARHRPVLREQGWEAVVDGVLDAVDDLADAARERGLEPAAVGLVVPGIVDEESGVAVFSANLGWRDVPLRALVEERCGLPVAFGHDVRAGGLAEGVLGAARDAGDFLFLALGTGIAGAAVLGGRPYTGGGFAGEIGHVVVEPGGRPCGCGGRGCLETVASAAAIAARYAAAAAATTPDGTPPTAGNATAGTAAADRGALEGMAPVAGGATASTHSPAGGGTAGAASAAGRAASEVTAADVAARARAGEPAAAAVWAEAVEALAGALAMYVSVLAPRVIVVGGGLAEAGEQLLGPLDAALAARLTFHRRPELRRAALGDQAGRLGAAVLAWRRAGREVAA